MNPIEIVKSHPWLTGGAVVALIVIFVVAGSGGGSQTVSSGAAQTDSSQVAAGLQMQQINAAASAQAADTAAKKEVSLASIAAGLKEAELNAGAAFNANSLAANLGLAQIATTEKLGILGSTLDAQTRAKEIDAETAKNQSMFDYLSLQTITQRDTVMAGYNAQQAINANNNQPKGLFSFLFG